MPSLRTLTLCAVALLLYCWCIALAWPHVERGVEAMAYANRVVGGMLR